GGSRNTQTVEPWCVLSAGTNGDIGEAVTGGAVGRETSRGITIRAYAAVTVIEVRFGASAFAALIIAVLSLTVVRLCAPYCTPARAALPSDTESRHMCPASTMIRSIAISKGRLSANSTEL